MRQLFEYYGRVQGVRGTLLGLPAWARGILFILAVPGILALALSILLVLVSLFGLFLLTVPAYRLLRMVTALPTEGLAEDGVFVPQESGRRHVDVKIIE